MRKIPLPDLPVRLLAEYGKTITYRRAYRGVLDGEVPAQRAKSGRWEVNERDLPVIAEAFDLIIVDASSA